MRRDAVGFTLVEVLIGITILVAGFVPVYFFLSGSEKGATETLRTVEAMLSAQTLLEEIANLPYPAIPVSPKRATDADYRSRIDKRYRPAFANDDLAAGAGFERSVVVFEADGCKRIKVFVVDRKVSDTTGGKRGELFLSTLVTR